MNEMDKPVIVIVGPTAVGKTELSISLAKKLDGEIISADSMQIYKGMDIGTAKPFKSERKYILHHMIDIKEPHEEYSVAMFKEEARKRLRVVSQQGKVPVVVGGTGLYINALIYDYSLEKLPRDLELREELRKKAISQGVNRLYEELMELDKKAAEKIHPNDEKRIIRALEVIYLTGELFSKHQENQWNSPFNTFMVGLTRDREELYRKIEERVEQMLEYGLVKEVKKLLDEGFEPGATSMQALGYKEIVMYLQGEITLEESIKLIKKGTKRLAKRQLSWFKRDPNIIWYNLSKTSLYKVEKDIIAGILQEYS